MMVKTVEFRNTLNEKNAYKVYYMTAKSLLLSLVPDNLVENATHGSVSEYKGFHGASVF